MEHVDVSGMRLAFRRRGTGPGLLLLHGGLCDGGYWEPQLGSLSDAFTVVAWDAPGCGGSDDPPPSFGMADYAACLAGFADALGLGPAHVLGHSWGSTLALALVASRPDLVRSLVLVGAYAGWGGSLPPDEVAARVAAVVQEVTERRGAVATMARAMADADLRAVLPRVAVPSLVLAGGDDPRSRVPVAEAIHRAIPGSTLRVLPGLGHESFVEAPATVEAEVRAFLAGVP